MEDHRRVVAEQISAARQCRFKESNRRGPPEGVTAQLCIGSSHRVDRKEDRECRGESPISQRRDSTSDSRDLYRGDS